LLGVVGILEPACRGRVVKLVVFVDKLHESLDIPDTLHGFPVAIDEVCDDVLEVFPSNELKKFQACGIQ
jgi:hypothetical protein